MKISGENMVVPRPASNDRPLRILFIVPYVPNLIRVRPYNLIRSLCEIGHQVTVVTFFSSPWEQDDVGLLAPYCERIVALPLPRWRSLWNCLTVIPTGTPLQAAYCWQPAGAVALDSLLRGDDFAAPFDVVHVEHLRGARYALRAQSSQPNIPVVWDSVDCISLLFRQATQESNSLFGRWVTRLELGRTEQFEGWISSQFSRVLVTSHKDREALVELQARFLANQGRAQIPDDHHIQALPNGVDLAYFQPAPFEQREDESLVISGKMSYHANVTMVLHLANEIMPRIWAHRPEVRLTIVGKDPAREIIALSDHPQVTVTGTVPDMRPYLRQATIAVAPLTYGAGIQNKVLEALACGTPTVTTSLVAASLNAARERQIMIADDPESFATVTLSLLADSDRRRALGIAGRAYVESDHDWQAIGRRLASIYRAALATVNN